MDLTSLFFSKQRFTRCLSLLILSAVLCVTYCSEPPTLTPEELEALDVVNKGSLGFALRLYRSVSKSETKNVLISPLSVQLVLALSQTGAAGTTASEIADLLSLSNNTHRTYLGYNSLVRSLESPFLKIANKIFVDSSITLIERFQKNAEKYFFSPAKSLNFQTDPENSRVQINDWAENQTNKKVTDLLAPGKITSDTRLVLINAIHFKASWQHRFLPGNTREQTFFISKNETVPVQMMNTKGKFGITYSDELRATILKLDYGAKDFNMIVILPDENDGVDLLESKLGVNISNIIKDIDSTTVIVSLPKFKMEETVVLNHVLESLGAQTMFSGQADFSGMIDKPVAVSSVVQKSCIDVNENGTEAASATAVVSVLKSMTISPEFTADHPFIFLIMHKNLPVFIGRFSHPDEI